MHYLIEKSRIGGEILIPPSKSQSLRAILFGAMGSGKSTIEHVLDSPDTKAMIHACTLLGANITEIGSCIEIEGVDGQIIGAEDVICAGNSGIVLRFISALAGLGSKPIVITGDHSIRHQRPMAPLLSGLSQLGISAISTKGDGFAPIIIQGPINQGYAHIMGEDSQYVSALLILSAFAKRPTEIVVKNPGEKPWIELTLEWLRRLGQHVENDNYEKYRLPGHLAYPGFSYTVPGDLSSSAFPIAAALVTGTRICLKNVDMNDMQGDKELIFILQKMGAHIEIDASTKSLSVTGGPLKGIDVDINNFIDAIPILATIATFANGTTRIRGASIARTKESNRLQCITKELKKMGALITEDEDGLTITGSSLHGNELDSHGDHRMAMSLCVAALGASGKSRLNNTSCIAKTFPTFLQDFKALGANIT